MAAVAPLPLLLPTPAAAAIDLSQGALDPSNFQPVCPASDGFYRFGQTLVVGLVGADSYKEYAPLIAGGLLRVRLELCVVESFFYEAIIPFVRENGLSWVLPLHETVETFLAGVVFAVATNFILLGTAPSPPPTVCVHARARACVPVYAYVCLLVPTCAYVCLCMSVYAWVAYMHGALSPLLLAHCHLPC